MQCLTDILKKPVKIPIMNVTLTVTTILVISIVVVMAFRILKRNRFSADMGDNIDTDDKHESLDADSNFVDDNCGYGVGDSDPVE